MKPKLPFFYDFVFPNFILPNALDSRMGIINYIHTLFIPGRTSESFFDNNLETPNSPMKLLFGNSLGTWPISLRMNGSNLRDHCYTDFVDIDEDALYLGKGRRNKYIYPIKMSPHFEPFAGYAEPGSKLNGEWFWKNMSAEALKDAQTGKAFIFLDWAHENHLNKSLFTMLHNSILSSGIPKSQIILAHNGFNAQEVYENWFPAEERRLTVKSWPFLIFHNSWHYSQPRNFSARMQEEVFFSTKDTLRDYHFLFRTRRARSYRTTLLYKLASDGLLDKGNWSCLDNIPMQDGLRNSTRYSFSLDLEAVTKLHTLIPKALNNEPNGTFNNIAGWSDTNFIASKTSYFDITTETATTTEYHCFTEKVCKPLVNFQPFLFVGFPGGLKLLRELGFKTFAPFIDESYDMEQDENIRLQMIYSEITRLCNMSKEEIHNWYWSMSDILLHNHRHFLEFHKTDTYNTDLIKYLNNCVN
jgi:hypothetical protein